MNRLACSVIVPIYKGRKYIANIINMIKNNAVHVGDMADLELILVNDYPEDVDNINDEVNIVLKKIENEDCYPFNLNIRVISNDVNSGIHKSRINGIQLSQGEYILMLDQDDLIDDYFMKSQLVHIKKADVVVANGVEQKNGYNKLLYRFAIMQWTVKYLWFYIKFDSRIISPGQCLIRKRSIPKLWVSNPLNNSGTDDYMLWLVMLSEGCKFRINRTCLYTHVYTSDNLSSNEKKMKKSTEELLEIIGNVIGSNNKLKIERRINKSNKNFLVKCIESINRIR